MAPADTARCILAAAAEPPLRLAAPLPKLTAVACRSVLNNLLKQGYVEECAAPMAYIDLGWRQQDGAWTAVQATEAGLAAIGAAAASAGPGVTTPLTDTEGKGTGPEPADAPQEPGSAPLAPPAAEESHEAAIGAEAAPQPSTTALSRPSLRSAAHRVLAAWDDEDGEH